ncbi:hypothetical protein WCP94_000018 (plasmid) [Bilophila wadsworthia]
MKARGGRESVGGIRHGVWRKKDEEQARRPSGFGKGLPTMPPCRLKANRR